MSKIEKIKRVILILLGLSLSAYLMYSGFEILNYQDANNTSSSSSK